MQIYYAIMQCSLHLCLVQAITLHNPDNTCINLSPLDNIAAISQTTFTIAFSWMKIFEISIQISLKFLPKGLIDNKSALVQEQATSHYLIQCLPSLPTHICGGDELTVQIYDYICGYYPLFQDPIHSWYPFYWHDLTLIAVWKSNYIHHKVLDEMTYP